jgi:phytoene/squalene synthetase
MSLDRISEAYRHCEALVRAHDKDHFLASLFAPAERRLYLFALYAFALEIARVKTTVNEPMAGMIRLQWWHEAIAGLRAGEAAASPVMIALRDAAEQTGVSLAPLGAAVEAHQAELHGPPAANAAAAIFAMAARFLGAEGDAVSIAADRAAEAVTFAASDPQKARDAYRAFRAQAESLPKMSLPAFLTVALVPLRLKRPDAAQWRRQIALLRTAWFGFPKL